MASWTTIDRANFCQELPGVLRALSAAEYVAVDVEMSGIRANMQQTEVASFDSAKDLVYERAKRAARLFTVIEFGMTCMSYSEQRSRYETETFQFFLTPEFVDRNGPGATLGSVLDRITAFSSSSMAFLNQHKADLGQAIQKGVSFLSRKEARIAQDRFLTHRRHQKVDLVDIGAQTREVQDFYADVRSSTWYWADHCPQAGDAHEVSNPHGGRLTSFQVKLVHQIVQSEFKDCVAVTRDKNMIMKIRKYNQQDEQSWNSTLVNRKATVLRQTGFRYVIEALVGGNFANASLVQKAFEGSGLKAHNKEPQAELEAIEAKLKKKRPMLVGHNCFHDVCFIYQMFLEDLPEKLEDFRKEIHSMFPVVVDTKYMEGKDKNTLMRDSSLKEVYETVLSQQLPAISETRFAAAPHNAGYDSWMTAVVFVKLAWKKWQEWKDMKEKQGRATAPTGAFAHLNPFGEQFKDLGQDVKERQKVTGLSSSSESTPAILTEDFFRTAAYLHDRARKDGTTTREEETAQMPVFDSEFGRIHGNRVPLGDNLVLELGE